MKDDLLSLDLQHLCRQPGQWAVDPFVSALVAWRFEPWAAMEKAPAKGGKSVAVVRLTGVMLKGMRGQGTTSTIVARKEIMDAAADPEVSAILLAIDSPGGSVAGTEALANDIRAAGRQKPVVAQIEDLGASAAFWAASQASQVFANAKSALVGSIGSYQVMYDESAAAEAQGVKVMVFATGSLKGMGTPGTAVSPEQASYVQSLVDSIQMSFDAAVQKGRGLSNKELSDVRHGGVMSATAALNAKLIDGIQPLSKTLAELQTGQLPKQQRAAALAGGLPMVPRQALPTLRGVIS